MTTIAAPVAYNPYAYEIHEDPYPTYARLRAEAPLYRNPELGFYALSRHDDVLAAFRDSARYSNSHGVSIDASAWTPHADRAMSILAMDPPRHGRMRALVSRGFTPRRVLEMEPRVRVLARRHLASAVEQGSFDFITDFAGRLPMDVISELVGVPEPDRAEVRRLADLLVHREEGVNDIPKAGMEAALYLAGYYADLVAERRARPQDDLVSALVAVVVDGDRLSDHDIIGFLSLMVVAGNETTTKLLGHACYWAWVNPDERAKAFAGPSRIGDWVDETLRYDTSSQMLARLATEDIELHDQVVPAGSQVLLLAGSANRDGDVFPDPDRFDLDRPATQRADVQQLASFGMGRHFCLGASLARLEARVALEELVATVEPDYEVDPGGIRRVHSVNVRGFAQLPISVRPIAPRGQQ